jgi:hypothetical protein
MATNRDDPALLAGLEQSIGHPPPFSDEERAAVEGPLIVHRARDLAGLRRCSNLRHLEVLASDITDLEAVRELKHLHTLRVACSPVRDAGALAGLIALQRVDLLFTLVEDVRPILGLAGLRYATLLGNPWSEASYELLRAAAPLEPSGAATVLDVSPEGDWRLTRRLSEDRRPACFSHFNRGEFLVVPGIPVLLDADCDFFELSQGLLEREIASPGFTVDGLFDKYFPTRGPDASYDRTFDFQSRLTIGGAAEAEAWLQNAKLPDGAAEALRSFAARFSGLTFYREDSAILERWGKAAGVELPAWLRAVRETLAFVLPHHRVRVRFDGFDGWSPHADQLSAIWYEFGLLGASSDRRGLIEVNRLFPVAEWTQTGHSNLAFRLEDESDLRVYEFDSSLITESGNLPDDEYRPIFDSYWSMLSHITALKLEDGREIKAQPN